MPEEGGAMRSMSGEKHDYDFAPVGPFALKISAEGIANRYGGKVVESSSLYGVGYYVVPLNMNEHFEVIA
jgi:hypothetical protein